MAPLVERGATAVVAASDLMALGTMLGAREHGLAVPSEWSAVGYDDTALMAYTDPPLTTVRQPIRAMCEHATRLLLDQLGRRRRRSTGSTCSGPSSWCAAPPCHAAKWSSSEVLA